MWVISASQCCLAFSLDLSLRWGRRCSWTAHSWSPRDAVRLPQFGHLGILVSDRQDCCPSEGTRVFFFLPPSWPHEHAYQQHGSFSARSRFRIIPAEKTYIVSCLRASPLSAVCESRRVCFMYWPNFKQNIFHLRASGVFLYCVVWSLNCSSGSVERVDEAEFMRGDIFF